MKRTADQHLGLVLLVITMSLSGLFYAVLKPLFESQDPTQMTAIRIFLVGVGTYVIQSLRRKAIRRPSARILVVASFLTAINIASFAVGLSKTNAVVFALISLMGPIFVYLGAITYLHEHRSLRALAGALVSLAGSFLLVAQPLIQDSFSITDAYVGNLLALFTSVSNAATILYIKKHQSEFGVMNFLAFRMMFAGAALLTTVFALNPQIPSFTTGDALRLAFYVLPGGILLNYLFSAGLEKVRASDSAVLFYLDPLVGVVAATVLLGESLHLITIIGAAIILLGVFVAHPYHIHLFHHYKSGNTKHLEYLKKKFL